LRTERFYDTGREDQRYAAERDHDRILYSSYFHRLAGVTQVVRAGEGDVFHTRQQHTHKAAQIGRRLAQKLVRIQNNRGIACKNLDSEVVAAAALAHDLGHPPFGHVGETVLNNLVQKCGEEGYEGNAQTFRILTKLAVRFPFEIGLNLTRATLCATLKYPWIRDPDDENRSKKWSAYASERELFAWARAGQKEGAQSLEAYLMDWADDIAYSVHDLEDFHRCNLIPWGLILDDDTERKRLIQKTKAKWHGRPADAERRLDFAFDNLLEVFDLWAADLQRKYDGSRELRASLREMTSALVGNFIGETTITPLGSIRIPEITRDTVLLMKQITRDYIISNPALAAQQKGHERIVTEVFTIIHSDTEEVGGTINPPTYLPQRFEYLSSLTDKKSRFVADCISGLTERELTELHARLTGISYGSVLDPIVR